MGNSPITGITAESLKGARTAYCGSCTLLLGRDTKIWHKIRVDNYISCAVSRPEFGCRGRDCRYTAGDCRLNTDTPGVAMVTFRTCLALEGPRTGRSYGTTVALLSSTDLPPGPIEWLLCVSHNYIPPLGTQSTLSILRCHVSM
ncbi:hypothetical protein XENTR_v10003486 [Xenopus tropicalis]|nr:hypothetical protein XENTR_v10003486 [Xenopus tropicalis]